jgi:hypothetical protein
MGRHSYSPVDRRPNCPVVRSRCADCEVGTITIGEWYMVKDKVWAQAWAGRRKPWHRIPGQEVLCIGCLEKRLGPFLSALVHARLRCARQELLK